MTDNRTTEGQTMIDKEDFCRSGLLWSLWHDRVSGRNVKVVRVSAQLDAAVVEYADNGRRITVGIDRFQDKFISGAKS